MTVKEICESTESVIYENGSVPQNALRHAVGLPEKRTEERTETHACDCVSREAAEHETPEDVQRVIDGAGAAAAMTINNLIESKKIESELAGIRKELHELNKTLQRLRR